MLKPSDIKNFLFRRFAHPWMPVAFYLPIIFLISGLALHYHPHSYLSIVLSLIAGIFSWTLVEYVLHRFIFHLTKIKQPWRDLASGLHLAHHRSSQTNDLILAPPISSLGFGSVLYLLFWLFSQSAATAALLESGLLLGYLGYEWVHYMAHRYHPKFFLWRYLKSYHLKHHFLDPAKSYGVTSPLWDALFQTKSQKA